MTLLLHGYRAGVAALMLILGVGCTGAVAPVEEHRPLPATVAASPAIPKSPIHPTPQQEAWQRDEMYLFVHFGLNTFTDQEWGDGTDNPALFFPTHLDTDQWARTARDAGFKGILFTAKHHDGFALWPTAQSAYSVAASPWQNGKGDVVRDVAASCRKYGLKFGIYLSPWDRHEPTYGTPAYDDFYIAQLTELLTGYGPIFEVWMDGANNEPVRPKYDLRRIHRAIRALQPDALIAILGPDINWVGNESGIAKETSWSVHENTRWFPDECDVPNRPGWFWHASEDTRVKTVGEHLNIYFKSVGRNCVLLLNVPPNRAGRFAEPDVKRLKEFRKARDLIFAHNIALGATATATHVRGNDVGWAAVNTVDGKPETFWTTDDSVTTSSITLRWPQAQSVNLIELKEAIQFGQRIAAFRVEYQKDGVWQEVARGTTVGQKRLLPFKTLSTDHLRVVIESATANPALEHIGVYLNPWQAAF